MHSTKILIVDDSSFTRKAIVGQLVNAGAKRVNIVEAIGAHDAFEKIEKCNSFDFVLADLMMPEGDGFSLMKTLQSINSTCALLLISSAQKDIIEASYKVAENSGLNIIGYCEKPIVMADLILKMKEHLSGTANNRVELRPREYSIDETLEVELLKSESFALESTQFCMYYQPKISADNKQLMGFEALARYHSAELGVISPTDFMPILASSSLLREFSLLTLSLVVNDILKVGSPLQNQKGVSINISADTFCEAGFVQTLLDTCKGIPAQNLILEVTESEEAANKTGLLVNASRLRLHGFNLSIDDFGRGYSNVNRLADMPFTELKIDRSYILDICRNMKHTSLVSNMIQMAKDLNMTVVAEGVETPSIAETVIDLGADQMQGFYIAQPLAFSAIENWSANWNKLKKHKKEESGFEQANH